MRLAIKNQYTSRQKTQKTMPSTVSIVPTNTFNSTFGLRGWRKTTQGGTSKQATVVTVDRPGSSIYIGADASLCLSKTQGSIMTETHKYNHEAEAKCAYDSSHNRYVGPNPMALVKKTASTIIQPDYYTSTDNYQKARAIDPEQHTSFVNVPGNEYSFRMTRSFSNENKGCAQNKLTTFKPRNKPFQRNNAVISSARTARLQHDTLTRENKMFRNVNGLTLHSNYIPGATPPYTIKSITELKCNVANMARTKIRHANRSIYAMDVGCFETCICP